MTTASPILTLIELEAFDPNAPLGGMRRRFCCPLCGDVKPRDGDHRCLSVHTESGRWRCFRCHNKGKLREFWLPPRQAKRAVLLRSFGLTRAGDAGQSVSATAGVNLDEPLKEWPDFWAASEPIIATEGAAYLERRGIPPMLALESGVRYIGEFFGRSAVLFPVTDQNEHLVAVAGRYCSPGTPKARSYGPKRLGVFATPGALTANIFVITEAPIDALTLAACDIPAIALCGTTWPTWLPVTAGFRSIALAFDADDGGDNASGSLTPVLVALGGHVTRWRPAGAKDWNDALRLGAGLPCWYCARNTPSLYTPSSSREASGRFRCDGHTSGGDIGLSQHVPEGQALVDSESRQSLLSVVFANAAAPATPYYHEPPLRKAPKR